MRHAPLRTSRHPASRLGVNPRRDGEGDAPLRVPNAEAGRDARLRAPDASAGGTCSHAAGTVVLATAVLAAGVALGGAQESTDRPPIVVHLADGSSVPLRQWSLSYEYFAWPQGRSQAEGSAARTASPDLWVGKKTVPLRGSTLAI